MIALLKSWAILTAAVLITTSVLSGVMKMRSWKTAVWVAALFGILQTLFFRFLFIITFPMWVLTFGLFTFVLQAFLLWVTDKAISDLQIKSFGWTLVAAFCISLLDRFGHYLFG